MVSCTSVLCGQGFGVQLMTSENSVELCWNQKMTIIKLALKDYIHLFFPPTNLNPDLSLLLLFCYIRQLDWRPERRAGPSRMRHERVVILKNMFHPTDFEVGNDFLTSKNSGMFSYKRVQSLPCSIFVKAYSCSHG